MCQTIKSSLKKNIHSTLSRKVCTTFVITLSPIFNHSGAFANFIKTRIHLPISCQISFLTNIDCSLMQPKREKLYQASRFYLQYDKPILLYMPRIPAFTEKSSQFSPFPLHLTPPVCAKLVLSSTPHPLGLFKVLLNKLKAFT